MRLPQLSADPLIRPPATLASLGEGLLIRRSRRARRLALRVHPSAEVEVVVPEGTPAGVVERFLARHADWVASRVARARALARPAPAFPPAQLVLPAIAECWTLDLVPDARRWRVREAPEGMLLVRGGGSPQALALVLKRWLVRRAHAAFDPLLAALAARHGLAYSRLSVRQQRTRWGSCSRDGSISLNLGLLFQSADVLRYLMIHELAHTRHMNHSRAYWLLVGACEPGFRELDRQLREDGWRNVPLWLRPRRRTLA